MRILVLLTALFFFFTSCNHSAEPKPDAERVIKDTLAQNILQPFNQAPNTQRVYVQVKPNEEKFRTVKDGSLKKLLSNLKTEPQNFVIDPQQANEITGENGTLISFKPNCFVSLEGKEISAAKVEVQLKECFSLGSLLNEGIADGDRGKISEIQGAVQVSAHAAGKELKLRSGESLSIKFPFNTNKGGYQFARGNENADGSMFWAVNGPIISNAQTVTTKEFTHPEFSFQGVGLQDYLLNSFSYPDEAKRNELSARVGFSFEVNARGKVTLLSTDATYKTFKDEIARVVAQMPAWTAATYSGNAISSVVKASVDFNIRRTEQVKVDFNEAAVSLVNSGNRDYILYGAEPDEKYQLTQLFDELGWYSYQRAINSNGKKADVVVSADNKTDVRLVLKHKNSVLRGEQFQGYSRFRDLAVGTDVYVVGVRYENGETYYAIQPLKLQKQTVLSLTWKKGDEKTIRNAFRNISV